MNSNYNILNYIRTRRVFKAIAIVMVFNLLYPMLLPLKALALTSGPTQPEVQSFEPVSTSDMVDQFTGSFTYNIPLFDLPGPNGGYPFNISYHSGIGMDEEASWVGLGWNLTPGSINREVRGLPDDMNGLNITKTRHTKDNVTIGLGADFSGEILGAATDQASPSLTLGLGITVYYNTYKGVGYSLEPSISYSNSKGTEGLGFGLSLDSQEGVGANASLSLTASGKKTDEQYNLGIGYNSRSGISMSLSASIAKKDNVTQKQKHHKKDNKNSQPGSETKDAKTDATGKASGTQPTPSSTVIKDEAHGSGGSTSFSFSQEAFSPIISFPTTAINIAAKVKTGGAFSGIFADMGLRGFFSTEYMNNNGDAVPYNGYGYDYMENYEANAGSGNNIGDFNREKDGTIYKTSPNLGIPSLTYDSYSVAGQGVSTGMFRPYRSDIGQINDPYVSSDGYGGSVGFDIGPIAHLGLTASFNYSHSYSGPWTSNGNGDWNGDYTFFDPATGTGMNSLETPTYTNPLYEKLYYKQLGELTSFGLHDMDYIGGEGPVRATLQPDGDALDLHYYPNQYQFVDENGNNLSNVIPSSSFIPYRQQNRMQRDNSIQAITNGQLTDQNSFPVLGEYNIKYYDANPSHDSSRITPIGLNTSEASYNCNYIPDNSEHLATPNDTVFPRTRDVSQVAGYTIVNEDGMRYVYGLPAYNNKTVEETFSVRDPGGLSAFTSTSQMKNDQNDADGPNNAYNDGYDVPYTDRYYDQTVMPGYAHSYLITSVLGADYVDKTGDGPSDDDLGYWVKFTYAKVSDNFKWRAPFSDANYSPGLYSTGSDDKASFEYGQREQWYLATAETKTHIAVFKISPRADGIEAACQNNGTNSQGGNSLYGSNASYKLDEIDLYAKSDYLQYVEYSKMHSGATPPTAIKKIFFAYTYDLCGNALNNNHLANYSSGTNVNTGNYGKLTLKKVWFTYGDNDRGGFSPYIFDYHENYTVADAGHTEGQEDAQTNPQYSNLNYDRWGNYKDPDITNTKAPDDANKLINFPYVRQFDPCYTQDNGTKESFKSQVDSNATVWELRGITLPTGAVLSINYEANDYGYVQSRQATQMFQIYGLGYTYASTGASNEKIYDGNWNNGQMQIYFTLKNPISTALSNPGQILYNQYLAGLLQGDGSMELYYKVYIDLKPNTDHPSESVWDYVSGYADLNVTSGNYGVDVNSEKSVNGITCYTRGYITVQDPYVNGTVPYHPFAVAGWQHMRTDDPNLLYSPGNINATEGSTGMAAVEEVKSLLSILPTIPSIFEGYRKAAFKAGDASQIDTAHSCIKLCTPDKFKYGGGCRVKSIMLNDNWYSSTYNSTLNKGEHSSVYGQAYSYTVNEGTAASPVIVSSGVAEYEPTIGQDENALRYAKNYPQKIPVQTSNSLFFEYPVNETYYPSANIGYSQVTVQSLASDSVTNGSLSPSVSTTGVAVYQFYTCKDFPVISDETPIDLNPFDLYIPIPFMGQVVVNNITASQGYSVELNDMNGKLKSVSNYALDIHGSVVPTPVSSVTYNYQSHFIDYGGSIVNELNDTVTVIKGETLASGAYNYNCDTARQIMGEQYDFYTDLRHSRFFSVVGGLDFNGDILGFCPFCIPLPIPWPDIETKTNDLRMAVTNKIIHKTGILISKVVTDESSTITTQNKLFDALNGNVVLSTVTNDFDAPIYDYEIPAHWEYDGMGASYRNYGVHFVTTSSTITNVSGSSGSGTFNMTNATGSFGWNSSNQQTCPCSSGYTTTLMDSLVEGDEFIMNFINAGGTSDGKVRTTLIQKQVTNSGSPSYLLTFSYYSPLNEWPSSYSADNISFDLVRSGHRNQLNANAGNIIALANPTCPTNRGHVVGRAVKWSQISADLMNFLKYLTIAPCGNNSLPTGTYSFGDNQYVDANGAQLFPILNEYFNYITISTATISSECSSCNEVNSFYLNGQLTNGSDLNLGCLGPISDPITNFTLGVYGEIDVTVLDTTDCTHAETVDGVPYFGSCPTITTESCINMVNDSIQPDLTYIKDVLKTKSVVYKDNWQYNNIFNSCSNVNPTSTTDLYALGEKGIWRPYQNYYYKDLRYQSSPSTYLSLGGVFSDSITNDLLFYPFNWNPTIYNPVSSRWIPNQTITRYNGEGFELENRDILGIYSAALYGYDSTLNVAVGANMQRSEMFYESFDDPSSFVNPIIKGWSGGSVSATMAHTGDSSLMISEGTTETLTLGDNFIPSNKTYVVSLWVAESGLPKSTYANSDGNSSHDVGITIAGLTFQPAGNVIDGWQRLEAQFTPTSGEDITIQFLTGASGSNSVYFDDLRIFPANGNIKTYVYNPNNFRLVATLDENNYATIYSYDEEGNLYLIKKETINGIKTIQESRSYQPATPLPTP